MIILIDKPKGITSFDVIRYLRKELNIKKMGHAGTLDPLASGLMIIATEKDTKKLNTYLKLPKTYEVEILLGESRATGDMEGEIIETKEVGRLENIEKVINSIVGENDLPVPRYSAIKVGGEALYKKARKKIGFKPPNKIMTVNFVHLNNVEGNVLTVTLDVESGAYIRSLVEEIGRRFSYPAVVKELRRTRIGNFSVSDARKIEYNKNMKNTYRCPICGLEYTSSELRDKCQSWCGEHHSCNLDIIQNAIN